MNNTHHTHTLLAVSEGCHKNVVQAAFKAVATPLHLATPQPGLYEPWQPGRNWRFLNQG